MCVRGIGAKGLFSHNLGSRCKYRERSSRSFSSFPSPLSHSFSPLHTLSLGSQFYLQLIPDEVPLVRTLPSPFLVHQLKVMRAAIQGHLCSEGEDLNSYLVSYPPETLHFKQRPPMMERLHPKDSLFMVNSWYLGKARDVCLEGKLGGLQVYFSCIISHSPLPINTLQSSYYANTASSHLSINIKFK